MGRWRPPAEASTAIITPAGHRRLREEFDHLWRELRPEVVRALSAAAAEGDRSENAEYLYRKKQLGEIDRRVRYLAKRLETVRIAAGLPTDRAAIFFGAYFSVEDDDGNTQRLRIVGPDEIDAKLGWISIDSPLARAALKKRVDDELVVSMPTGTRTFVVTRVEYREDPGCA
jgi:transcription elongation factor GreB